MEAPAEQAPIRILAVDDNALLREGIAAIIESQKDMVLISQAVNGTQAIRDYRSIRPDVTLMDLRLPDMSGIEAVSAIRGEFPDARLVVLTTFEDDAERQRALKAGAVAFLLKSMPPSLLLQAIRQAHAAK